MRESLFRKAIDLKIEKLFTLVEVIEAEYKLLLEEYEKLKSQVASSQEEKKQSVEPRYFQ